MNSRPVRPIHIVGLFVLIVALLSLPLTPLARIAAAPYVPILSNPCALDPNNLFYNGTMAPGADPTIADGWTPFTFAGSPPQYNVVDNEKIDPQWSQQIFEVNTFDAGIQQTVSNKFQIGVNYWTRWGYSLAAKSYGGPNIRVQTIGRQFGVNPYGGTDPHSAQIIWGPIVWDGGGAVNLPQMTIVFTAQATSATFFLRAIASENDGGENRVWIDALCMEARPDLTPSPTPPTPSSTPPTPSNPTPSTNFLPLVARQPTLPAGSPTPSLTPSVTPTTCSAPNIVTTISVGAQPKGIATDAATNRAFVSLFADSSVAVIDAATNLKTATWSTNSTGHSNGIGFANNRLFVALRDVANVAILDASSGAFAANRAVGSQPWGVGAANNRVWVANFNSGSTSVIDALTNSVVGTTSVGAYPALVAPAGTHAFVSYMGGGIADIGSDGAVLNNFAFDSGAFGVAFNAGASRVYVGSRDTNKLAILNASNGSVVTNVTLPQTPNALAFNSTTNHLYVVYADVNQVSIRDGTTLNEITTLAIGAQGADGGDGIAVMNNRVYVSNNSAGTLTVIRDACP